MGIWIYLDDTTSYELSESGLIGFDLQSHKANANYISGLFKQGYE
jgi:hypothetical protein